MLLFLSGETLINKKFEGDMVELGTAYKENRKLKAFL